jgi:hypothetical protein
MKPKYYWLLYWNLIIMFVLLIAFGYFYFLEDNPPIEFYDLPFQTNQEVYRAGDEVVVHMKFCKGTSARASSLIVFENDIIYHLPAGLGRAGPPGCREIDALITTVPHTLPPGRYNLRANNIYAVNLVRDRTAEWWSTDFDVVADPAP